jgi:hypothetical protein
VLFAVLLFAVLLFAALLVTALRVTALLLTALLFVAVEALRLAATAAGFRAAVFFFATRVRAAAEVLLARFAAFFRPPVAEPFRFAITRSFRNVRNQQLP